VERFGNSLGTAGHPFSTAGARPLAQWQKDINVTKTVSPQEILALPMETNDAKAKTVRDYIVSLAAEVWREGEGFSGKRPFGNSDWEFDLYRSLIAAGLIDADADGYPDDRGEADRLIRDAIESLRTA
jgi:hypothetical protein